MEALKNKIINEGCGIGTSIVKVDGFLNHQVDVKLLEAIGEEFHQRFKNAKIDKILTVEASGIAIAAITSRYFGYIPVVFAKKTSPSTMVDGFFEAKAKSFTKGTISSVIVSKKYLKEGENILILDDFLAHGEAATALTQIVNMANANVSGIGIVIDKKFQGGGDKLKQQGYDVESLAVITKIEDGQITFGD